jgi:hypothetical protein
MGKKRLGPLEKPLRMAYMCFASIKIKPFFLILPEGSTKRAGRVFGDRIRSSEAAMVGGGAQRPVWLGNEPKKTGARSARARTRGQNPLVPSYLN